MAAQPKPFPGIKPIHVYPDGHAEKDPEHLSIDRKEEALFSTKLSKSDVEVVFDNGTPFNGDRFQVRAGTETPSGPLRIGVKPGEQYHYHIRPIKGAGSSADPTIIIDQ
ncbi:MAG TPA: hypothetical protein VES66_02355 [Terriglobales bacterium]|nr:hypothetical protein [Terriglobales bacterium]